LALSVSRLVSPVHDELAFTGRHAAIFIRELSPELPAGEQAGTSLALGAAREIGLGTVAAARLAAALADINRSFTDPNLTLEAVARRQGVSPRYLQKLLEETGTSFTARVNELRLHRAFVLLNKAQNRRRRISEIAWQAGFSNIPHFNRLFRARYGDTPSRSRT
jgi:AraC-like DNA-binding protein